MTSAKMVQRFQVRYDKLDTQDLPDIPVEQALIYLNDAVDEIVQAGRLEFEKTSKVRDDISSLVKTLYILPETDIEGRVVFAFDKARTTFNPEDEEELKEVYYFLGGDFASSIGEGTNKKVGVTKLSYTQQDDISPILSDPFNKPKYADTIPVTVENQSIIATPPSYLSLNYLKGRFILKPNEISQTVDCDLPKQLHKTVVKMAVLSALETVESQRTQTFDKAN
jgi:hypothetical protein